MKTTALQKRIAMMFCVMVACHAAYGQSVPSAVLQVDVQNLVAYIEDTADGTKFATLPNVTPAVTPKNFYSAVQIGDIVAVNGQPAKGTLTIHARRINLSPNANPGDAIADTGRLNYAVFGFEFLTTDGIIVGSLISAGLAGTGTPPPGSPAGQTQGNNSITGGTGAFLGARGTQGQGAAPQAIAVRTASITEDPANRRKNGGGTVRFFLQVIPMTVPQVVVTSSGPAVAHSSDFSLVSAAKPATPGEVLSLFASGLGPTRPGVDIGQPFPASPQPVNSPVEVLVNGKSAELLAAVGYPGAVDGYQVNFRVPADAAKGATTIQIRAAWISGPAVSIPVQ